MDGRQAFHLAESQMVRPPRPRSAFGWSGWFVALVLGIFLLVLINGRGGIIAPAAGSNEAAAASAVTDHRSQPAKIEPAFLASTGPSEIEREILQREAAKAASALEERAAEPAVEPEPPAAEPEPPVALAEARPPTAKQRRAPRPRAKPAGRGNARPAETEEDFLQREGYIY